MSYRRSRSTRRWRGVCRVVSVDFVVRGNSGLRVTKLSREISIECVADIIPHSVSGEKNY